MNQSDYTPRTKPTVWQKKSYSFNFRISLRWIIRRTWKDIRFKANWYDNNIHAYQVESSSTTKIVGFLPTQILCFQKSKNWQKIASFYYHFYLLKFIVRHVCHVSYLSCEKGQILCGPKVSIHALVQFFSLYTNYLKYLFKTNTIY